MGRESSLQMVHGIVYGRDESQRIMDEVYGRRGQVSRYYGVPGRSVNEIERDPRTRVMYAVTGGTEPYDKDKKQCESLEDRDGKKHYTNPLPTRHDLRMPCTNYTDGWAAPDERLTKAALKCETQKGAWGLMPQQHSDEAIGEYELAVLQESTSYACGNQQHSGKGKRTFQPYTPGHLPSQVHQHHQPTVHGAGFDFPHATTDRQRPYAGFDGYLRCG